MWWPLILFVTCAPWCELSFKSKYILILIKVTHNLLLLKNHNFQSKIWFSNSIHQFNQCAYIFLRQQFNHTYIKILPSAFPSAQLIEKPITLWPLTVSSISFGKSLGINIPHLLWVSCRHRPRHCISITSTHTHNTQQDLSTTTWSTSSETARKQTRAQARRKLSRA